MLFVIIKSKIRLNRSDSVGMKFRKIKIIGISQKEGFVKCICDCGNECEKLLSNIRRKYTSSCGCLIGERHNKSRNPDWKSTYDSWSHMKGRCRNKNDKFFHNYGGRGIEICERWGKSFEAFINDMGKRPEGYTLDRIDVNGMYCPDNCRWATKSEQDNNRRRTVWVNVKGVKMSFTQACRKLNISYWIAYYPVRKSKKTYQQSIDHFINK